jgi:PilZ domain-containing protein
MTRHVSGTYRRTDRVHVRAGETVRLRTEDRQSARKVTLLELSLSDMLLSSSVLPPIGATVGVMITLRDRHIEFEVPALVAWHREGEFAVTFGCLTARQMYGITLALELERQSQAARPDRIARACEPGPVKVQHK